MPNKFFTYYYGARKYQQDNPQQRRGQAFMNYLFQFDKDAYTGVRCANSHLDGHNRLDPWDHEESFPDFLIFLEDRWRDDD